MKKYNVNVYYTMYKTYAVEATDETHAIELAWQLWDDDLDSNDGIYVDNSAEIDLDGVSEFETE